MNARAEDHAGGLHQVEAPLEEPLLHLELRDAVAEKPTDAVGFLQHGDGMPGAVQLLGSGQAGRTRADHGHLLAGARGGGSRGHPALVEGMLDDPDLDLLDGDGVVVDAEHAGAFARRRTEAARELREVVRGVQAIEGLPPTVAVDEIVPVGNKVAERAALMAEGDAAVHAAGALLLQLLAFKGKVDLLPVMDPLADGTSPGRFPLDLEEAGDLAHAFRSQPWAEAITASSTDIPVSSAFLIACSTRL